MERIIRKMGRYALVDKLGQGSMGVVYKAYDEMLDRYVALKTMASDMNTDADLRKRFYQEARLAAKLNHPHIITVYDLGEVEGQIYIAMELLEGQDLKSLIKEGLKLTLEQKLEWMIQLCEAVAFAHRDGIVHRDIKPGNIHIRNNGELVVMDFGIARAASSDITKAGMIIGTPEYISPEQILAIRVDHRADIFSLGVVFYELLTNSHPFRSPNLPATIHKVLNEKPPPPREIDSQLPEKLDAIVLKAMEKDVNNRYQNCGAMLQDLLACQDELSRQAKDLISASAGNNAQLFALIGRLQELYSRREFLQICEELGYDPSTGSLAENLQVQDVSYSQALDLFNQSEVRLNVARQYLEGSAELETLMQAGKTLYSEQRYEECLQKMEAVLAYSPRHELATEYINQCRLRIQELREAEERRKYVVQVEQTIMSLFQSSDITNCQREAMRLLEFEPDNTIARNYLKRCEDQLNEARRHEERKKQVAGFLESAAALVKDHRIEEAVQLLETCLELDPRNPEAKALMAQCQSAIKAQQLKEKKEREFTETINRAISLRNNGELNKALNLLLDARKIFPDSPQVAHEIQVTEQEIRSSESYQMKLRTRSLPVWIYPSVLVLIVALAGGLWWLLRPRTPFTETETKQILSQARTLSEEGRYEESFKTLQIYLSKDPTNAEAQEMFNQVKDQLSRQRLERQNQKLQGMLAEARRLVSEERYTEAIRSYEAVLNIDPLNREAEEELRRTKLKIAQDTSREKLEQEIRTRLRAAQQNLQSGKYGPARVQLAEILQLDPANQQAKNLLKQVDQKLAEQQQVEDQGTKVKTLLASARNEFARKRYDRALAEIDNLLAIDPGNSEAKALQQQINAEKAKPRFGSITVNCEPFGTAYLDGQPIGETPIPLRRIPVGRHTISIRRSGYLEVSKTFTISEGEVQHLQFTLQKQS